MTIVYLSSEEFHDADLVCLEELPDVEEIWIPESITDAGLDHLRGMTKIKEISLYGPGFTDAGLRKLRGFGEFRGFLSDNAKFTDEGLRELSRHHKLQTLYLFSDSHQPRIPDAGIRHLRQLKNLSELIIEGVKISEGAVEDLRRALPHCDVCIYPPDEEE